MIKRFIDELLRHPWLSFPVTVLERFGRDNGGLFAAGLSFFMLLSMAPLLLTSAAVMACFIHSPLQVSREVGQMVGGFLPSGTSENSVTQILIRRIGLMDRFSEMVRGRTVAGVLGFAALIWSSMQIFVNASVAMNAALEVHERRSWLGVRATAVGLMFTSAVLIAITLFLTAVPSAIVDFGHGYLPGAHMHRWLITLICELLAIVVNTLLYVIVFQFLPSVQVGWAPAFAGGLTASLFWEIAKKGLASWLLRPNHTIYGDLANVILFLVWIYYSMVILLIGAGVAAEVYRRSDGDSATS